MKIRTIEKKHAPRNTIYMIVVKINKNARINKAYKL